MKKYLILALISIAFLACNSEYKSFEETSDSTSSMLASTDTTMSAKIIKNADMKFRVKNVQQAKKQLTMMLTGIGGKITNFSIDNKIENSETVKYSQDSLIEFTVYRTEGFIKATVPSDKLDDFMNGAAALASFVDFQSLKIDDKGIAYLSNQLKSQNRVEAVAQLNKHANKRSNNVETSLLIKDDYIDKKIENLLIDEKVKYSNITLHFYQNNTVEQLNVANDKIEDFRPSFFDRSATAIRSGWLLFTDLLFIILKLWAVIALLWAIYGCFHYRRRRKHQVKIIT